jgi:hypothetical protein
VVAAQKAGFAASLEALSRILLLQDHLPEGISLARQTVLIEPSLSMSTARLFLGK